jgi:nitrous oxide reductase
MTFKSTRLLMAAGALMALAACSDRPMAPRATSSTTTPDSNGRTSPTPMNTAPAAPMR